VRRTPALESARFSRKELGLEPVQGISVGQINEATRLENPLSDVETALGMNSRVVEDRRELKVGIGFTKLNP
jgi:hypothetical protein